MRTMAVAIILIFAGMLVTSPVSAEERNDRLRIHPDADQADITLPRRSMDQDDVREAFGEPSDIRGPVGDPPITRWDYGEFTVYFEHDLVLHAFTPREDIPEDELPDQD